MKFLENGSRPHLSLHVYESMWSVWSKFQEKICMHCIWEECWVSESTCQNRHMCECRVDVVCALHMRTIWGVRIYSCMSQCRGSDAFSHACMCHVTCTNASWHTYDCVMPQNTNVMSRIWTSHASHTNESCHTYECVMSHIRMRHGTSTNGWFHEHECDMTHLI